MWLVRFCGWLRTAPFIIRLPCVLVLCIIGAPLFYLLVKFKPENPK